MLVLAVSWFVPLLIYIGGIILTLGVMYGVAYVLGERHRGRETGEIYESGIKTTGEGRFRYSAQFYLVAMLFVIFDLEVVFLFAWAIGAKELGWFGYSGLLVFVAIVVVGLIYEWRNGALDWVSDEIKSYHKRRRLEK